MNRSLTASMALAAILGIAGLAQAQSLNPSAPSTQTPSSSTTTTTAPGAGTAYGTQAGVSAVTIQQAQQELRAKGLYHGVVDGRMGPETQTALSEFQRQEGLPQTAMLDQQTVNRLIPGSSPGTNSGSSTMPQR
jgi:peptidoglycan hydrolase-like protein with peptidoglycan-binding domain